ncbi:MAG: methionine synthase [Planctomycetota bacterium]
MTAHLRDLFDQRVVLFDGGMGATVQNLDLDESRDYCGHENCTDILVRSRPDLVHTIHDSFLAAGSDAVETNTFGANKLVFAEFDDELVAQTYEINREAAGIARAACDAHSTADRPRFVVGSLGPGTKLLTLGQTTWGAMLDSYHTQVCGLLDGGADALLIETCQDLLQVKCAINACLHALRERDLTPDDRPIMVSVTIETTGTMLVGSEIAAAAHALRGYPIASLGLNCATGPTEMAEHLTYLSRHWSGPISVMPNAGLPVLHEGKSSFPLQPEPFADALAEFVERFGVRAVGGCCGTTPDHIARLAQRLESCTPLDRDVRPMPMSCTSLYTPTEYRQDNSFLIVGERMNASGSRLFKRLLEEESWDEMVSLAKTQSRHGAHVLDVNVDYAGRDNAADMEKIVHEVARQVDVPLMIDSTQIATLEAGLRSAPGKCIINSTNFEDGDERFDEVCRLARTYNAGVVIGTIDEDEQAAMARTADRKFEIATRGFERATREHGLAPADIFFDPLVLPISTGMADDRRSALELIHGTKRIAEAFPECQITCGLSNVSFGLKPAARLVLNSVLLHELVEAGLTSAIVHASKILPLNKLTEEQHEAALDLIYDRRAIDAGGTGLPERIDAADHDPLAHFIELFKDVASGQDLGQSTKSRTLEEWLQYHIIDGEKQELTDRLDEAMQRYAPLDIINDHLLEGMKVVGELFASGDMQLPFVLQSAEVMKMAVAHLEPHMERVEGVTKGRIVLATVKGDVHDIGKNLVDIILTNNGYTVHNIGIKQPISNIIDAWRETGANAVGMSGLLVKSVVVMEENLRELNEQGIDVPIMLGGAALSRHYAESHLRSIYNGSLYYGRDAFEGLRICDALVSSQLQTIDDEINARLTKRADVEARVAAGGSATAVESTVDTVVVERSEVATDVDIPAAPFWGDRVIDSISLDEIYPYINPIALFRGQWGFKKGSMTTDQYQHTLEDVVHPIFERLKAQCRDENILQPRVVYGFYPCHREQDDLVIFDPDDHDREIERFSFPRQRKGRHLCISDFFRGAETGEKDVVAFHCVTMGREVSERARILFEKNEYSEYLYMHGIGVETAEALAELWHKRIRAELGLGHQDSPRIADLFRQTYRGSRYSFGYPACPDMQDQEKLFRLLKPERIGCELTDNWQIDPEQSTSAIVVHHPEAKYFNV